jgi:hypothetical protein
MGVKVILNRFLFGNRGGKVHSEGLCEYGRIILKWMLWKYIRMVFDYSCPDRSLSDILMNPVVNLEFHKLLGNPDMPSNHLLSQEILYTVCV